MNKIIILVLVFFPIIGLTNWSLTIDDATGPSADVTPLMPFTYDSNTCLFDFFVYINGTQTLTLDNTSQCNNTQYLVLDGFKYPFTGAFNVEYNANYVDIPAGINMNACQTISGDPIETGSPHLIVNLLYFQLNSSFDHHIKHEGSETHFVFESFNQDVVCAGGISVDLIFSDGFEL